ncbi:MAG: hypothetical protein ACJ70U_06050 [Nitrososphaera sp.]
MLAAKKRVVLELKFTKQHEWLKVNEEMEGGAIIGISDFAQ